MVLSTRRHPSWKTPESVKIRFNPYLRCLTASDLWVYGFTEAVSLTTHADESKRSCLSHLYPQTAGRVGECTPKHGRCTRWDQCDNPSLQGADPSWWSNEVTEYWYSSNTLTKDFTKLENIANSPLVENSFMALEPFVSQHLAVQRTSGGTSRRAHNACPTQLSAMVLPALGTERTWW